MTEPRFATSPDELLSPAALAEISGFEFIDGMRDGTYPHPPIAQTLEFRLDKVDKGRVEFLGRPPFAAYNPLGGAHGGWYGTLLDSCMACAVQTTLPRGRGYTTLEYKINIMRPARAEMAPLRAIGTVVTTGQRVATATGQIVDDAGKVYAIGSTTCLVFDL